MNNTDTANFLGRGWSFPPAFNKDNGTADMVSGEEDISQSIGILFSTHVGERVMFPDYGSKLQQFLFERYDESAITYLKDVIEDMILKYEPRISLHNIDIDDTNALDGIVIISLDYSILSTNSRNNVVFPFYKSEGTLVSEGK